MQFDIYRDNSLAASLVYGRAPAYYGANGAEIADLLAATEIVYNLWTAESGACPEQLRADWWVAWIISAPLARAGFDIYPRLTGIA